MIDWRRALETHDFHQNRNKTENMEYKFNKRKHISILEVKQLEEEDVLVRLKEKLLKKNSNLIIWIKTWF